MEHKKYVVTCLHNDARYTLKHKMDVTKSKNLIRIMLVSSIEICEVKMKEELDIMLSQARSLRKAPLSAETSGFS